MSTASAGLMDTDMEKKHPGKCLVKPEPMETLHMDPAGEVFLPAAEEEKHASITKSECEQGVKIGDRPTKPYRISFIRSECGRSFQQEFLFNRHRATHATEKPYSCPNCDKSFSLRAYLIVHQRVHCAESPYPCLECGKSFSRRSGLSAHLRVHSGEQPFTCLKCGRSFQDDSLFKQHMTAHTKQNPHCCSVCGKRFSRRTALCLHQRVHTGERPYSCAECGKSFSWVSSLSVHQRIHSGSRPYPCAECGKSFNQESHFKQHMTTHTKEKPFLCQKCGKSFSRRWSLTVHEAVHSGERRFCCLECGTKFSQKCHLQKHQRRIHAREAVLPCNEFSDKYGEILSLQKHQNVHLKKNPIICTESSISTIQGSFSDKHLGAPRGQHLFPSVRCGNGLIRAPGMAGHQRSCLLGQTAVCTKYEAMLRWRARLACYLKNQAEEKTCCGECVEQGGEVLSMHPVQKETLESLALDDSPKNSSQRETIPPDLMHEKLKTQVIRHTPPEKAHRREVVQFSRAWERLQSPRAHEGPCTSPPALSRN